MEFKKTCTKSVEAIIHKVRQRSTVSDLLCILPVVNYKDDNLSQSKKEFTKFRDGVISVIHTREVDDIQAFYHTLQVVEEWDCGTFDSCCANWNLVKYIETTYHYDISAGCMKILKCQLSLYLLLTFNYKSAIKPQELLGIEADNITTIVVVYM